MNKFLKVILAILGGADVVFNIFIPISVVLILIHLLELSTFNLWALLIIGILSTSYRAIRLWIIEE
ncbi:hypothetical protein LCGC14_1148250 [marine sediment metagenome]|uniref:Uncharacterized protein n=1 Tax=marine sediment metagenome TaxID=412755 RepID=A0A0F9M182_9ZZZZ